MSPSIMNSPLLTLPAINSLLSSVHPDNTELRIQLLSAKIHLLTNSMTSPSPPSSLSRSSTLIHETAESSSSAGASRASSTSRSQDDHSIHAEARSDYKGGICSDNVRFGNGAAFQGRYRDTRSEIEILRIRLDLGRSYLRLKIPNYLSAEAELTTVEKGCKGILKRLDRTRRHRDHPSRGASTTQSIHNSSSVSGAEGAVQGDEIDKDGAKHKQVEVEDDGTSEKMRNEVRKMRLDALRAMIDVEEGLGRTGREDRWRKAIVAMDHSGDGRRQ
ncbi:hypothetical protein IAR55_002946 [Kwoniella newhampshirensis]|uniref:SHSP domain-containing protein n=1 Tax=Kwoniella newhampshirensis TaxID=1651941 RepID=A0AAW0Z0E1_9TREE